MSVARPLGHQGPLDQLPALAPAGGRGHTRPPTLMEIGLHDAAEPEPDRSAGQVSAGDHAAGHSGANAPDRSAIVIRHEPAGTVVAVTGELDLLSAPQLRTALEALLPASARHIAIDLTHATFMDSAGVHAVLDASDRAGGHLAVICAKGPVRQVIDLVGLTEVLNVVASLDEYRARRAGA